MVTPPELQEARGRQRTCTRGAGIEFVCERGQTRHPKKNVFLSKVKNREHNWQLDSTSGHGCCSATVKPPTHDQVLYMQHCRGGKHHIAHKGQGRARQIGFASSATGTSTRASRRHANRLGRDAGDCFDRPPSPPSHLPPSIPSVSLHTLAGRLGSPRSSTTRRRPPGRFSFSWPNGKPSMSRPGAGTGRPRADNAGGNAHKRPSGDGLWVAVEERQCGGGRLGQEGGTPVRSRDLGVIGANAGRRTDQPSIACSARPSTTFKLA